MKAGPADESHDQAASRFDWKRRPNTARPSAARPKIFLERAKRRELLREEQAVARLVDMQMCVAHAFDRLAHAQQYRVRVEGAVLDQMARDPD